MSNITPENVAELQHIDWLKHPVTVQMIKNIRAHKKDLIEKGIAISSDYTQPDNFFRSLSYGAKTIDAILRQIENTDQYLEVSKRN
jgi:hypothetical protein